MKTTDYNREAGVFHSSPELWDRIKPLARQKRHEPTPEENRLWQAVRGRQVDGLKFRRQYTIDRFIVDFCCLDRRLILEVDGEIHQYTPEEDAARQEFLEAVGFHVLRFTNQAVRYDLKGVLAEISWVASTLPSVCSENIPAESNSRSSNSSESPPLQHGEGAGG